MAIMDVDLPSGYVIDNDLIPGKLNAIFLHFFMYKWLPALAI